MSDPFMPETVATNGISLSVMKAGPAPRDARAALVFLHGFPDLAYGWKHQIVHFAERGYAVIAPDLRGYGGSDKPLERDAYGIETITADITGLLDHYGIETAIVIGHDWGALIGWSLPFLIPERLKAVANLNVPFIPRGTLPPSVLFRGAFGEKMYIVRFQEEGPSEAVLERDVERSMRFFLRRPKPKSNIGGGAFSTPDLDLIGWLEGPEEKWPGVPLLDESALAIYVAAFKAGGFTAPLHYYRSMDANWQTMARFQPEGYPPEPLSLPALMITAGLDGVCPPRLADGMERFFSDYRRVDIPDSGHWTQQEKPETVNAALGDWIEGHVLKR